MVENHGRNDYFVPCCTRVYTKKVFFFISWVLFFLLDYFLKGSDTKGKKIAFKMDLFTLGFFFKVGVFVLIAVFSNYKRLDLKLTTFSLSSWFIIHGVSENERVLKGKSFLIFCFFSFAEWCFKWRILFSKSSICEA